MDSHSGHRHVAAALRFLSPSAERRVAEQLYIPAAVSAGKQKTAALRSVAPGVLPGPPRVAPARANHRSDGTNPSLPHVPLGGRRAHLTVDMTVKHSVVYGKVTFLNMIATQKIFFFIYFVYV